LAVQFLGAGMTYTMRS